MKQSLKVHFINQLISWIFRRRPPEVLIISAIMPFLIAATAGIFADFKYESESIKFDLSASDIDLFLKFVVGLLVFVILICVVVMVIRFSREQKLLSRKRIIVVEGRGLRDDIGDSLAAIAGKIQKGNQTSILLDLRQKINETIVQPEAALPRIIAMRESLNQLKAQHSSEDLTIIYGGLTSVPFTFLTGAEIDDEGSLTVVDWVRDQEIWRELDGEDDGLRFTIDDYNELADQAKVLLAVSVSYPITDVNIGTTFNMPLIRMNLEGSSSDAHWSKEKQAALSMQFLETVKSLAGKGVKEIHLILAAPNSVCFNFGRRYDRRNLPDVFVYQFEYSQPISYPWSVRIASIGIDPTIVHTDLNADGFGQKSE